MNNAINILRIILHVLELMRKYKLSKNEAAATTAGKFGVDPSDVLKVLGEYLEKKVNVKNRG